MDEHQITTAMVHYECYTCHMTATCVDTNASRLAWLDHMENHGAKQNYGSWTWTVVQLPL